MDYQRILEEIADEVRGEVGKGHVASYIPALAGVLPGKFGMAVRTLRGQAFAVGDAAEMFSIQSISKVFALTLAMQYEGETLFERVGREPSGNPFNSLVQLEYEHGIPRNPFINAGALVVTDCLLSHTADAKAVLLDFVRRLSGNAEIAYDEEVARSEKATGQRNAALAYFLKSFGNLKNNVEAVLDAYFYQCALRMSCEGLARAFLYLANEGVVPATGERLLTKSLTKRINALLLTGGTYDAVGDFAYRVGLPGKSGVGGGIAALMPGELGVCVWAPELNPSGNSLIGTLALELFTTKTGRSIF